MTNQGLIVVDGKLPSQANYDALMALIKGVSDQPIKYLIVTHHHADHTGNNQRFLDAGVQVVAHDNLKKNLATYAVDPKPAPPSMTYPGAQYIPSASATSRLNCITSAALIRAVIPSCISPI